MKKIIFALVALFITSLTAIAQDTTYVYSGPQTPVIENLGAIRPDYASLVYDSNHGYTMYMPSTNKTDSPYIIDLGLQQDKAIASIDSLISIGKNSSYAIFYNREAVLHVFGKKRMGSREVFFKAESHKGDCFLNISELQRARKLVASHRTKRK